MKFKNVYFYEIMVSNIFFKLLMYSFLFLVYAMKIYDFLLERITFFFFFIQSDCTFVLTKTIIIEEVQFSNKLKLTIGEIFLVSGFRRTLTRSIPSCYMFLKLFSRVFIGFLNSS